MSPNLLIAIALFCHNYDYTGISVVNCQEKIIECINNPSNDKIFENTALSKCLKNYISEVK